MPCLTSMQRADADVMLDQSLIGAQSLARSLPGNPPALQDDDGFREIESAFQALFDEQDRHVAAGGKPGKSRHELLADDWGEPFKRLVEEQDGRAAQDGSRRRQHLLLAAGQLPAEI